MAEAPRGVGLALGLAVAAMSTAAILIRLVQEAGPLAIAFHRMALASLVLAPFALGRGRAELAALARRDLAVLGLIGVILGLHFATWITSLKLTTVASSVVLVTFHPAIVALLGMAWLGEGLRARGWAGIAVALGGAVLLVQGDLGLEARYLAGDALAFAGAVFAALYFLGGRRLRPRLSLTTYAFPVYAAASGTLLVLALASGERLAGFGWPDYALMAALALGPQLAGHTVANWSLRWVPAAVVSTAIVGEPIGSSLLAVVILAEVPPAASVVGGALILAGIYLVASGQRPKVAPVD
ncbi:MAG TPA: DMT family transporter [Candidatus Thermoplasmatota archaeon]|nr:DMT family transporter [Candidatus Thermoplasmatota archaeon]